jgi:hypothetical protein
MVLIAGLQPDARVQLGAMGVLFASHSLAFMASSGFGAAVAIRTANELGEGVAWWGGVGSRFWLHLGQHVALHLVWHVML